MKGVTRFSFELPNDEKDLIDIANLLVKKAKRINIEFQTNSNISQRLEFISKHRHVIKGSGDESEYDEYRVSKYGR